jgi:hypothetical protein
MDEERAVTEAITGTKALAPTSSSPITPRDIVLLAG